MTPSKMSSNISQDYKNDQKALQVVLKKLIVIK
jgi:hypothetical protein